MSIRVLIADDQSLIRGALAALLDAERDIAVVADCSDGSTVVNSIRTHEVDVALLDIDMPNMTGIEAAEAIQQADLKCRSMIVTTFGRPGYVKRALAAGVSGFVVKDTPPEQLAEAVRRVHAGHRVIDPALAEQSLFQPENPLTEREQEICRLALEGATTAEMASGLHVTNGTVRNHVSAIISKTNTTDRHAAARVARDQGWI